MACYISSNDNRFYAAVEQTYGEVAPVLEKNRIPAVELATKHEVENAARRDKIGGRTYVGAPSGLRRKTTFDLTTYMTSWDDQSVEPSYGLLFLASLGGGPLAFAGGTVSSASGMQLSFTSPHGLTIGQGVSCGGEIRFVAAIVDSLSVILNAPFTRVLAAGTPVDQTVTYAPSRELPSISIFDYWSPGESLQRVLAGAAVDKMRVRINGDFHEFSFSGVAADLVDSGSFSQGQAGLTAFPLEPAQSTMNYSIIPGNLGQAWLGNTPDQFFTITSAQLLLDNNLDVRAREFGQETPRCIAAGRRSVYADFSLYGRADNATKGLYQAARQRSAVSVMFQLGQQTAQLCGVYLKSVVPEVPEFEDDDTRLEWRFRNCRAQGTVDDEIFIAFG